MTERNTKDAKLVINEYQQRFWEWPDGYRMPYSVAVPPAKQKRKRIADGTDDSAFTRSLYSKSEFE